ncbi:hypothetical protein [Sphingopyxis chilensis]|uniref:hypothetical protein n=1 Tax=Sphingopyxis chilensis TaxID=180400 RepID=UPI002DDD3DAD|nr:hypothetical protein [Sphingopyxis chilensis]
MLKAFDHPRAACDPLSEFLIRAPDARSFRMCRLDRRLVAHMGRHLPAQTAACVMDTFGISINSWVKMREDQPVRRALAERLIMRLKASGLLPESIGDDAAMTCR